LGLGTPRQYLDFGYGLLLIWHSSFLLVLVREITKDLVITNVQKMTLKHSISLETQVQTRKIKHTQTPYHLHRYFII